MQMQSAQIEHLPMPSSAVEPVLLRVPAEHLGHIAASVLPMIDDIANRSGGRWTSRTMLEDIYTGRWDLWVVWDGASIRMIVGTELYTERSGNKFLALLFATGDGAKRFAPLVDTLEAYAAENGCRAIHGMMRKGWARHLPDYRMSHVLLEKEIA